MTLAVRGVNSGVRSSSPITVALPAGSAVGDFLLMAVGGGGNGDTLTPQGTGWTDVVASQSIGSGMAWCGVRQVTSGDIASGVAVASATSQATTAAIIVFSGATGFGAGSITKRTSTSTGTTAPAASSSAGMTIVVVQIEKSSANASVSVSPATTLRVQNLPNGTSQPSVYIGTYLVSGTAADRTLTNVASSANALGMQVAVTEPGIAPPTITVKVWDGAAEQPVSLAGVWDGAAIQPVSVDTVA
jgi:hypothetical protein